MMTAAVSGQSDYYYIDEIKSLSFIERISDLFQRILQDFSFYLSKKGWKISSLILPAVLGEPIETMRSAARRIFGWKSSWERHGFYDAGNPKSLEKLVDKLKEEGANKLSPVLLFHGIFSTPDIWMPWSDALQKSRDQGKIGHVVSLQLPDDLEKRMGVVDETINRLVKIYQHQSKINLVGHSLGGSAAHLAAFEASVIQDENGMEKRWHYHERNQHVGKVISIAAPTWLCCNGQKDETTVGNQAIYPEKAFSGKKVEGSYSGAQIKAIRESHKDIYDIVGTQDGITATVSPLPPSQVCVFKLGHLGVATSKKVCEVAIGILSN